VTKPHWFQALSQRAYLLFGHQNLRRNFSRSKLVRLLSDLASVQAEDNKQDVAERLSQWLDAFSTVRLDGALHSIKVFAAQNHAGGRATSPSMVEDELQRTKAKVSNSITAGATLIAARQAQTGEVDYGPYYQRYQELQRQMDAQVAALRTQVRQTLSKSTSRLMQLAALDGVLEQMFSAREQKLWATVPVLLEKRFEQLRAAPPQDNWQTVFSRDWQAILLAELDERLQPVVGLIEALTSESKTQA
jgi:hypothetical protein